MNSLIKNNLSKLNNVRSVSKLPLLNKSLSTSVKLDQAQPYTPATITANEGSNQLALERPDNTASYALSTLDKIKNWGQTGEYSLWMYSFLYIFLI